MTAIIGMDPGLSGSWGAIDHNGKYLGCGDMHNANKIIHTNQVWMEICQATEKMDREFVVESVHAMPKQGVSSTFTFGMAYMAAIAIAQRSYRPTTMVTPQKWKKAMGLSKDKNLSLDMARELWPEAPLKRKKDNGRAEALLISEFFRREMHD
jgi:crossover junction endodeoxyribonuclease RuvC